MVWKTANYWLRNHRHNLKQGLIGKLKLAQHMYEESRRVGWDEAIILEIESHSRHRKHKESAHMACSANSFWALLLSWSHLSAMTLLTHRDLYDVTVRVRVRVTLQLTVLVSSPVWGS
jgi:hypothetical protein